MNLGEVLALPIAEEQYVTSQTVGDDGTVTIELARVDRPVRGICIDKQGVCWHAVEIDGQLMREQAGEVALVHRER